MTGRGRDFLRLRLRPWGLLGAGGAVLCAATAAGFMGRLWWILDLCSHFRVQYLAGLAVLALIFGIARRHKAAVALSVFACANLAVVLPGWVLAPRTEQDPGSATIRVMLANVNTSYGDAGKVLSAITGHDPDVIVLEEVSRRWLRDLAPLAARYPHVVTEPREDNFGIALYSRLPLSSARIEWIGGADVPSVVAEVETPDGRATVIGTHPLPPASAEYSRWRNDQLEALPGFVKGIEGAVVLLGDLNVSPWSHHFRNLVERSGLIDSARGRGWQPTWPAGAFPLLIPIDHCLHSEDLVVTDRTTGPGIGSDHLPLVVNFAISVEAVP